MRVLRSPWLPMAAVILAVSGVVYADDVSSADRLLCSSAIATVCDTYGDCEMGLPWNWNVPSVASEARSSRVSGSRSAGSSQPA